MLKNSKNKEDSAVAVLLSTGRLSELLDSRSLLVFSETCRTARDGSVKARKKHALKNLLTAVAEGNEALARQVIKFHPELLLDSHAIVTDLSGKKIENLTPLQAAICAGDLDMIQMMQEVLQQKLQSGIQLSFDPKTEIHRQFIAIYPDGIDSVEKAQKIKAAEFKNSNILENYNLRYIFAAINAASVEQVKFELKTPGQHNANSPLNAALHNFRAQFAAISKQELIFNPFYLLNAFAFLYEEFNNFTDSRDWEYRDLFWRQVIGYIQRHLPACYLQAFAQGIYYLVKDGEKLKRDFKFGHDKELDKEFYMRANDGDVNNLGYKYAAGWGGGRITGPCYSWDWKRPHFQNLLLTKKSGLGSLKNSKASTVFTPCFNMTVTIAIAAVSAIAYNLANTDSRPGSVSISM